MSVWEARTAMSDYYLELFFVLEGQELLTVIFFLGQRLASLRDL